LTEETSTGVEDPGGQERPALRVRARTVRIISVVLAIVLVVAAATAVMLWRKAHATSEREAARAAATNVATQFALRVDTFDGKDIDQYGKSIQALLTTKYKADFDKQFEPFKELYTEAKATSTGKILVSGVGSSDADSATVLVVHDAQVKSTVGDQQRHHRWSIDLVEVEGKWLVDEFTPVT